MTRSEFPKRRVVAVIGAGECDERTAELAREVGRGIAQRGFALATGGLGGVMEAASEGARRAGGTVLGILPGTDVSAANRYCDYAIATGVSEARNAILVNTAEAFVAIAGSYGTLSEIAFALRQGKPVCALGSWKVPGAEIREAASPDEALEWIFSQIPPSDGDRATS